MDGQFLTHDSELQTEGGLSGLVAGDAGVGAGVVLRGRVDDQRVDAVLPHHHPVDEVGVDGPAVHQPHQLRVGKTVHLQGMETTF